MGEKKMRPGPKPGRIVTAVYKLKAGTGTTSPASVLH